MKTYLRTSYHQDSITWTHHVVNNPQARISITLFTATPTPTKLFMATSTRGTSLILPNWEPAW